MHDFETNSVFMVWLIPLFLIQCSRYNALWRIEVLNIVIISPLCGLNNVFGVPSMHLKSCQYWSYNNSSIFPYLFSPPILIAFQRDDEMVLIDSSQKITDAQFVLATLVIKIPCDFQMRNWFFLTLKKTNCTYINLELHNHFPTRIPSRI